MPKTVVAISNGLFVVRGVFSGELGIAPGDEPHSARIAALCARYGERPIAAMAIFR